MILVECFHSISNRVQSRIVGTVAAIEHFYFRALGSFEFHTIEVWECRTRSANSVRNRASETRCESFFAAVSLRNTGFENHGFLLVPVRGDDADAGLYLSERSLAEEFC